MRRFWIACCLFLASLGPAQPVDEPMLELLRSDVRSARDDLITRGMAFSEEEAAVFWPVYREYEFELRKLNDEKISIITEYVETVDSLTDAKARELVTRVWDLDDATTALQRKYWPEFNRNLSGKRVAQFYQLERQLNLLLNVQIAARLPLIGG